MNATNRFACYTFLLLTFNTSLAAETEKSINAQRVDDSELAIDGSLDEDFWHSIPTIGPLHQVTPLEFSTPSQKTEIKVAYSDDYLLIGATLYETNLSQVNAGQLIQGRAYEFDDQFHMIIDTFNDKQSAYFFQLNPNGIRREALIDNSNFHGDWTTIWQANTQITENGWTLEMAIPFKSISFNPDIDEWGINFGRVKKSPGEVMAWSSKGADSWEMAPDVAGSLKGIKDLQQGLGLDIKASATVLKQNQPTSDTEFEPSLDIFYKPSADLNLALTLNTDFSATEVDDRTINLTRFSVFLPEKRDFFLQDMDIFKFGNINGNGSPFFSRKIGLDTNGQPLDINIGSKITGRTQDYSYGLLGVQQEDEFGQTEEFFVGRIKASLSDETTLGLISTYGAPNSENSNQLVGADFNYRNTDLFNGKTFTSGLWYQQTDSENLQGDNRAYGVKLNYPNDDLRVFFSHSTIEKNFNPALGFVNRSGIKQTSIEGGPQYRFKDSWLRSYFPWTRMTYVTDTSNRLLSSNFTIWPLTFTSIYNDEIQFGTEHLTEVLDNPFEISSGITIPVGKYKFDRQFVILQSSESREFSGFGVYRKGEFFGGTQTFWNLKLNWRPNKHFYLSALYDTTDNHLPQGHFKTELMSLKGEVAINSKWSWLTSVQYDNISDSTGLSSRLKWQPNALSALTLVYNSTDYKRDLMSQPLNQPQDQNRLAIKYSYIFRM